MSKTTTKTTLALYVTTEHKDRYFRPICYPVILGPDAYERAHAAESDDYRTMPVDRVRNASDRHTRDLGLYLQDFRITALGSDDDAAAGRAEIFGLEYLYHQPYSVKTADAVAMARTLQTIDRRMGKVHDTYGPAADFPSYAARVAQCIGATQFVAPVDAGSWSYNDTRHRFMAPADGVFYLHQLIRDWRAALAPKPAAATA